jgi:hypothetical protein
MAELIPRNRFLGSFEVKSRALLSKTETRHETAHHLYPTSIQASTDERHFGDVHCFVGPSGVNKHPFDVS